MKLLAATVAVPAPLETATLVTATGGAHHHHHGPAYSPPFVPYGYAVPAAPWAYAPTYAAYAPMAMPWAGAWWPHHRR
jgi:hypothetical protein